MNITQYGRVEVDLSRIPTPASMSTGRSGSFADTLRTVEAEAPPPPEARKPKVAPSEETPGAPPEPGVAAEVVAEDTGSAAAALEAPRELPKQAASGEAVTTATRQVVGAGESPAAEASRSASPRLGAAADTGLQVDARAGVRQPGVDLATPVPAGAPNPFLGDARIHSTAARDARVTALRPTSAPAGYRTMNPQSVQMMESARDSIFKQILFRLGKESSELRMRLDPPELGELDLRLTVEKGGQMRLYIGTERPELAAMLDRNMDALRHTLQQNGLQVVHAEVHSGSQSRGDGTRGALDFHGGGPQGRGEDEATPVPSRAGWISAEGLDFWV